MEPVSPDETENQSDLLKIIKSHGSASEMSKPHDDWAHLDTPPD
jgi:hypothetical protein